MASYSKNIVRIYIKEVSSCVGFRSHPYIHVIAEPSISLHLSRIQWILTNATTCFQFIVPCRYSLKISCCAVYVFFGCSVAKKPYWKGEKVMQHPQIWKQMTFSTNWQTFEGTQQKETDRDMYIRAERRRENKAKNDLSRPSLCRIWCRRTTQKARSHSSYRTTAAEERVSCYILLMNGA